MNSIPISRRFWAPEMHTLLLRLQGPLQSWGLQSRFSLRESQLEPTKSGVLGMICAALGFDRGLFDEPDRPVCLRRLARLRMGVRVDSQGMLRTDYHTAQGVQKSKDGKVDGTDNTVLSKRQYLVDADFVVGLEGDSLEELRACQVALMDPVWPLSLGRKAFPPGSPVTWNNALLEGQTLVPALSELAPFRSEEIPKEPIRYVLESGDGALRNDVPVAPFSERRFGTRRVVIRSAKWGEVLLDS